MLSRTIITVGELKQQVFMLEGVPVDIAGIEDFMHCLSYLQVYRTPARSIVEIQERVVECLTGYRYFVRL